MTNPFAGEVPEKMIKIEATGREASLIQTLRRYPFGKFIVTKFKNRLTRIVVKESKSISEESGLALEIK